jgi:hypothetical protein
MRRRFYMDGPAVTNFARDAPDAATSQRAHSLPAGERSLRLDALITSARPDRWRRDPAGMITPGVIIGV